MLIQLLIALAVIGVLLYLFNVLVTMDAKVKSVINALVFLVIFILCIKALVPYLTHLG